MRVDLLLSFSTAGAVDIRSELTRVVRLLEADRLVGPVIALAEQNAIGLVRAVVASSHTCKETFRGVAAEGQTGLRFVIPLIGFFGAGNGVDEDYYLPAATRDGIDPSALAVDVEEGTQALSGSDGGEPLLLQGDDLKQARIRLALARRDEPEASFDSRTDVDGKIGAPPPAAPRPSAVAAEWVR